MGKSKVIIQGVPVSHLTRENGELRYKIEETEQYMRKSNVITRGVPEDRDEDVRKLVTDVANELGVELERGDIKKTQRLPSRFKPRPIIAQLNDLDKKPRRKGHRVERIMANHYNG